ncbi:MAG: 4-(cytidine 5'-diphospho)-2-C-methyl-D-erythritol kinase [Planctomycetes bacterium]|nr:4-(cytidine 5'-diphospho)-2-C-methyl-D-erythritol kinase [Planctomycetota bacterium]
MKTYLTTMPQFERTDAGLICRAPAKINLYLKILGRDREGYHLLDSAVAKITLYDEIHILPRDDGQVRLFCSGLDCGPVEENLVLRTVQMLQLPAGVEIKLNKRIPIGAGMGGGSSDAAITLMGLNRLFDLKLTDAEMMKLASRLGSDVPLFLDGPSVRIRDRGEIIEPIQIHPFSVVLIVPDFACSTAEVYAAYDTYKQATKDEQVSTYQEISNLLPKLQQSPDNWYGELFNDLAIPAMKRYPSLQKVYKQISTLSPLPVHITGSGSGMFIICRDDIQAQDVASRINQVQRREADWQLYITRLNPW